MKIYRAADNKIVPSWALESKVEHLAVISSQDTDRILSMSSALNDDDLVLERDRIEKCASEKTSYFYNVQWPEDIKSQLKEYAVACNMDMTKFQAVDPSLIKKVAVKEASSETMIKTASTKLVLSDPFKLDNIDDNPHMAKANWQDIKKEAKLAEKPAMSGIVPIRGGENYFTNPELRISKGQNSIADPNAIDKLAKNEVEDTGARLQREKREKEVAKTAEFKKWQESKAMPKDIAARSVFPTESLNAQPGIKGNVFDFDAVPELTDGEKLKTANEDRKRMIQGEKKEKHEFRVEKNPTPQVSDSFAEELKKYLNR